MKNLRPLLLSLILIAYAGAARADAPTKADRPNRPDTNGWYSLFNGKDFTGWKKSDESPDTFQVVDGEIVAHGSRCHLFYVGPVNKAHFENFDWKCEILTKPNSNSGMYFHTKYQPTGFPSTGIEAQINNSHPDPRKTGSLYRAKDIMDDSPAKDDEWFTQEVIVQGRHVVVKINDKVVNDYNEPRNPQREPGFEHNVLSSGTFALQGHDPGSEVHFRKVLVKPLP